MGGFAQVLERAASKAARAGVVMLRGGLESGERSLARQGPASKLLASLLREHEQTTTIEAGKLITPLLEGAEYIAKDPMRHAEYYRQRVSGVLASDQKTSITATQLANTVDSIYHKHVTAGFKTAPRVKSPYFSEMYPREMFERSTAEYNQAVQLLMQRKGKTLAQAERTLDTFNPNQFIDPITGSFHPIESRRTLDLPELARKDVAVDLEYIVGGIRRFHEIKIFGQEGEKAKMILDQIRKESGESSYNFARGIYSNFMHHNPRAMRGQIERSIQSYEVASHLGLAVFAHPTKTIESVMIGGIVPFLKAVAERFANPKEFREFGMFAVTATHDAYRQARMLARAETEGIGSKVLRATQFQRLINFQGMFHASLGKHSAIDEFAKLMENPNNTGARLRLKTLGFDVDELLERGTLSEDDLLRAGNKMDHIIMGGRTVLDLPPMWKTSMAGRLLTMFKPFFFLQAKFIKNSVLMPALRSKDRDIRPLLYAAVLYPTVGELATDLKHLVRGRTMDERPDWEKYPYDRVIDSLSQVGGFGIAADVFGAMTSSSPTATWRFLFGPVAGDAVEAVGLAKAGWETKERAVLRRIPTIGPALSRYLVPPKHRTKGVLERGTVTKTIESLTE